MHNFIVHTNDNLFSSLFKYVPKYIFCSCTIISSMISSYFRLTFSSSSIRNSYCLFISVVFAFSLYISICLSISPRLFTFFLYSSKFPFSAQSFNSASVSSRVLINCYILNAKFLRFLPRVSRSPCSYDNLFIYRFSYYFLVSYVEYAFWIGINILFICEILFKDSLIKGLS